MAKGRERSLLVGAISIFIVVSLIVAAGVAWVIKNSVEGQVYKMVKQSAEGVVKLASGQVYIANEAGKFYEYKAKEHAKDKVKTLVESVYASIDNLYKLQQDGVITSSQAQAMARNFIQGIRYDGNTGYIFVMDTSYRILIHPSSSLVGKNEENLKDPTGKPIIKDMVDGAVKNGSVFVSYMWTKPGYPKNRYFPKISYAMYFKPWNWIIATGEYIDYVYNDAKLFKQQMYMKVGKSISSFKLLSAYPFIMDKDGYLIIHPKYDMGVELDRDKQFKGIDKKTGENIGQKVWALMQKENKNFVEMDYFYTKPGHGNAIYKKLGFFYKIPGTDLIAAFSFYEDDMQHVAMAAVMPTMSVLALFTIILILLMWYILRYRVIKRLKVVENISGEIASGNLTSSISIKGNDEIATVVRNLEEGLYSLRSMIGDILKLASTLQSNGDKLIDITDRGKRTLDNMVSTFTEVKRQIEDTRQQVSSVASSAMALQQSADEVANAATNLSTFGAEVTQMARDGEGAIENVINLIQNTEITVKDAEQLVDRLAKRSEGIGEIVATISDIAEQTNLLALNAAIEAARAGEAGRGFAVVADEIRKLAENTQRSVEEIADILRGIREDAENVKASTYAIGDSVSMVKSASEDAGKQFESIVSKIVDMNTQVESLAAISEEQSATTAEVSSAIENVSKVMEGVAYHMELLSTDVDKLKLDMDDIENAAREFVTIAENLYKEASKFKV